MTLSAYSDPLGMVMEKLPCSSELTIPPLIELVRSGTPEQKEHAAVALQNLADNADNKFMMTEAGYHLED